MGPAITPAQAHEVRPAVADASIEAETLTLDISVTLEALVAGINLAGIDDTDDAPQAARYDALRALGPDDLRAALEASWPYIQGSFRLSAGETPLTPEITGVSIPPVGDIDLPRDSRLTLSAPLPDDDSPVTIGWSAANGPLILRQISGEASYDAYLTGGAQSDPLPRSGVATQSWISTVITYVTIGFEHIIPLGLDHILFVLGLFFFALKLRPILIQVTAFTLAHTATLALAILGYVSVPASIVEPLIAASIVYIGIENIIGGRIGVARTLVVFAFGLLHGLGFAFMLNDIGLSPGRFITGLIAFNVGVELGQLTVIAAAFLAVGLWFGKKPWYQRVIATPASVAIAVVGAWWFIERVWLG